ncbi:MAG: nitrile hydratase subunit alpha [Rhodospirillaceae bacterium]|nr:nitrile hydratase subunit alpha [Rhodospirillaceae bacterium]|tara:strand:+ start:24541 stop:25191 length:651 start_codon:yes stop_codon:yes gene_type:complete
MAEERGSGHHDHDHDHDQTFQPDIEDSSPGEGELMAEAIRSLLIEKEVLTAEEVRAAVEQIDSVEASLGGRIVARAWCDSDFKERLLENGTEAVREFGADMGEAALIAVENTEARHNVIVCTLCSCYPRQVLGLPPDWYKSRAYRSRVVIEPRAVLEEFGTKIPDDVGVSVHDSTADIRYIVIPMRPAGTEDMNEDELAALVTRDALVGVTLPKAG